MSSDEKRNNALMQFGFGALIVILIVVLVLTGHDGSPVTTVLTSGFSVIVGVLFTNAARDYSAARNEDNDHDKQD